MKVLIIHNHYKNRGGEDAVVEAEVALLKKYGHEVIYYTQSNAEIDKYSFLKKIHTFFNSHWSKYNYLKIKELIAATSPDIMHVHNTLLLITPAVYYAAKELGIPVVQTLHNYRFICPNGEFYFKGRICEYCLKNKDLQRSLFYGCWRRSRFLTAIVVKMLRFHESKNTFKDLIDCHIALSEFSRDKFIAAGYAPDKITVKPNFVSSVPEETQGPKMDKYALFVGRLSEEKGVRFLVKCWEAISHIPLKIMGTGELLQELKISARRKRLNIEFLGEKENEEVAKYIKNSSFTIFPSQWYEPFGRVIIESFACGIPVIASSIGAAQELVSDHKTGLLFMPADRDDLIKKVNYLWGNAALLKRMGENARAEYLLKYTEEINYEKLMRIYARARGG